MEMHLSKWRCDSFTRYLEYCWSCRITPFIGPQNLSATLLLSIPTVNLLLPEEIWAKATESRYFVTPSGFSTDFGSDSIGDCCFENADCHCESGSAMTLLNVIAIETLHGNLVNPSKLVIRPTLICADGQCNKLDISQRADISQGTYIPVFRRLI